MTKRLLILTVFLFLALTTILLAVKIGADVSETAEVKAVVERFHSGLVDKDEDILSAVLSDTVRLKTRGGDDLYAKNDYISEVVTRPGEVQYIRAIYLWTSVDNNYASLHGWSVSRAAFNGAENITFIDKFTFELEKRDAQWRITSIAVYVK